MDWITAQLYTTYNVRTDEMMSSVVSAVLSAPEPFLPERFGMYEPYRQKLGPDSLAVIRSMWFRHPLGGSVDFVRRKPDVAINVEWKDFNPLSTITIYVDVPILQRPVITERYIALLQSLAQAWHADYGYAAHRDEALAPKLLADAVWPIRWLNIFGSPYVRMFGREKLLGSPCHRVEELENGAVFLMTAPSMSEYLADGSRLAAGRVEDYLGREYFDPGIAPDFGMSIRCKPAGAPAGDSTVPQVLLPDAQGFVAGAARIAQELCARCPAQANKLDFSPESLKAVDRCVLKHRGGEQDELETHRDFLRSVTAYYGEVLRRNLGGNWIVRQTQEGPEVCVQFQGGGQTILESPTWTVAKLWLGGEDLLSERYPLLASGWIAGITS